MRKKFGFIILTLIILPALFLAAGCGGDTAAKAGDTVKVHYTGKFTDGTQFDSSAGKEPLQFALGSGQVIPGFDEAVTDMKVGEKKTVTIPVDKAYGPHDDSLVFDVPRDELPANITPQVGMQLSTSNGMTVTIIEVTESSVKLDANHPMAGKDLVFDLELVEIEK